uniref:Reverse transcriptase domain-containing protein n=1 Tax=Cuerna arida TaxID=1464854 RepID=A0A1B6GY92_9HEMI
MYADDTVLLLSNKHPEILEVSSYISMNMAVQYCHQNNLVINETKTNQLVFGRRKEDVRVLPSIETVREAKYLGVVIDEDLKWTPHVDNLCNKLSSGLYVIRRIRSICNVTVATTAYYALFETHLRYAIIVWGKSSVANLERPLILQKRCIRILAGLKPRETCRGAFVELSILTTVSLYILETIMYAHNSNLTRGIDVHTHNTRHGSDFTLPVHRSALFEEKPSYMGAKLFNALPADIKRQEHLKTSLKRWLLQHPFYSIDEFFNWRTWNINH